MGETNGCRGSVAYDLGKYCAKIVGIDRQCEHCPKWQEREAISGFCVVIL